jgi:hypothetical protein
MIVRKKKVVRALIFNATGDRKPETLLEPLLVSGSSSTACSYRFVFRYVSLISPSSVLTLPHGMTAVLVSSAWFSFSSLLFVCLFLFFLIVG